MGTKRITTEEARIRSQRTAAKTEQRLQEAEVARLERLAEQKAVAEKTARLRALRLAKEAADAEAAAANGAGSTPGKASKRKPRKTT